MLYLANPRQRKGRTMARKARRRGRRSTARRRYRRNPSVKGLIGSVQRGAMDAGAIVVGKAATRTIVSQVGLPAQGATGVAVQFGAAVVAGHLARRFIGADFGRLVTAGGMSGAVESFVIGLNVPYLSSALSAYPSIYLPRGMGAYPSRANPPLRVARSEGLGMVPDEFEYAGPENMG